MAEKASNVAITPRHNWSWLALLAILVLVAIIRARFLDYPLERDEGEYAYAGQLMLQGIPPYQFAYNMKLPGTYAFYAAIMALFGQTALGIHFGLLLVNLSTIVFVFLLGRMLFSNIAGLISAATYGLMAVAPDVDGFAAHATHFVVFFAVPGLWLLLKAIEKNRISLFIGSGLLLGMSFLMKQPGAAFGVFAIVFLAWNKRTTGEGILGIVRPAIAFGAGMATPFLVTCVILAMAGVWDKFLFWTFSYAGVYGSMLPLNDGLALLRHYFVKQTTGVPVFWLLGLATAPLLIFFKPARPKLFFLFGLSACSAIAVSAGLYFRPHYFVLALPALALVIGAGVHFGRDFVGRFTESKLGLSAPVAAFVLCWAFSIAMYAELFFKVSPAAAAATFYDGNPFLSAPQVADYIRQNSSPNDSIAVLGSEPEIYFHAQRRSATGFIYAYPLMESHPYALRMQQEMIEEIERAQPKFLVVVTHRYSWLPQPNSGTLIFDWMNRFAAMHYRLTAALSEEEQNDAPDANRPLLDWKNSILLLERIPES